MTYLEHNFQVFPGFQLTTFINGKVVITYDSGIDRFYADTKLLLTIEEFNSFNLDALNVEIYPTVSQSCPIIGVEDLGTQGKRKVLNIRTKGVLGPYNAIQNTIPPELAKPDTITSVAPKKIYHDVTSGVVRTDSDFKQKVMDCKVLVTKEALKRIYDYWLTIRGGSFSLMLPNIVTDSSTNFTNVSTVVQILTLTNKQISPAFWEVSYTLRVLV